MIGFFLNTLVFRTRFSGEATFREILRQVRQVALDAFAHQDLPFEQLVEALQPERNMSHSPLFQVAFVMVNNPAETMELPGLKVQPFRVEENTAKYDLTLFVIEGENRLTANVEYSTDLFDAATIRRMLQHFTLLLEGIVADPKQRVSALPLMGEEEMHQLLVEWNETRVEYQVDKLLHSLFEAQVERTPDATALVFESLQLTYRELNKRANQLAHYLRRLGVGPEVLVGVCMERSVEMIVSILGVLKAGGAYVPLDWSYPAERLAFMLEDSQARVLLTQRRLVEEAGVENLQSGRLGSGLVVVCVDEIGEELAKEGVENPASGVSSEQAAYVIYTSGSTGQPKGVIIPHGAICNHMLWQKEYLGVDGSDRILQKTAFSFDAAGTEFYLSLLSGAELILARAGGQQDSAYLVGAIIEQGVTILQLVPSLLRVLLGEEGFERCESLRCVICAGEALAVELQERFKERLGAKLYNFYGPTEAAIDVTCWPCDEAVSGQVVPIGRPIANTEVYLLDEQLQVVPVGVAGELHIGGANLGRGYLRRPELTAEKFIPHPFSQRMGERLYKSGDRARYLADGRIEYLGRVDHQVKVRGFRIELGEVEAALRGHPGVGEAVVMVRGGSDEERRLVGYLVRRGDSAPSFGELRKFLRGKLPEYMVPGAIVWLEALPLAPNGKLDRGALPEPGQDRPELESAFVAPRNPIEEKLAEICAQLLRLERVGVHDNFFELGGHSLLATQFMSRLRNAFQIELPLRSIFEGPTIAELAEAVEKAKGSQAELRIPAMKPVPREARRTKISDLPKVF
jgi:amino acid adenylation domain-containing protein